MSGSTASRVRLTVETLFTDKRFEESLLQQPCWSGDGTRLMYLAPANPDGINTVYELNATNGRRAPLVSADELRLPDDSEPLSIQAFQLARDGRGLLLFRVAPARFSPCGDLFYFDLQRRVLRQLTRSAIPQYHAMLSPDGSHVGLVRGNDLWAIEVTTGAEQRLTHTGSFTLYNGRCGWVYEEELGLGRSWEWAPDGGRIAYLEQDESLVPEVPLTRYDRQNLDPEVTRYPKAGQENPRTRLLLVDLATREIRYMGFRSHEDGEERYLTSLQWTPDGNGLLVQSIPRRQNSLFLHYLDPRYGTARLVLREEDEAWVDSQPRVRFVSGSRQFLWLSDRSGWRHVYLVDLDDGAIRRLTDGEWEVLEIAGVSEQRGEIYVTAAMPVPENRTLIGVRLNDGEARILHEPGGSHSALFAQDGNHYLHSHSSLEHPAVQELRSVDSDASLLATHPNSPRSHPLRESGLHKVGPWRFFWLQTESGTTLRARMLLPPSLAPGRRYPAILYVYGGPGSQVVVDTWGGRRELWHRWLARQGYVILKVDNRGTGGRGRNFCKQTARRLGQLETDDQIAAARFLSRQPYVHPERIGIWGWSYGGYMAAMCILKGADVFRAAAAVAPVTDWALYDTIYTERAMGLPEENSEGYREGSPVHHAHLLRGRLLLVHGLNDDNVHFQHTARLASALQDAGKPFEMMVYPGKRHGIEDRHAHLYTILTEFFRRCL